MSLSIREIARLASVSSATVSRVVNGSNLVTPQTRARIEKIINDVHFVPDRRAVHLKNGKSQIYGIIIPDLTNPFFTELVKIFEALLFEKDQELLVANTDFHATRSQRSLHRMLLRRVDGVAFLGSEMETASLEPFFQNRIPVVTTDHYRTASGISDITIDFADGMMQAVEHLRKLGHRQVGFIGGTEGLVTSRVRKECFLDEIVKQDMSSRDEWMVSGNYRIDGGDSAMEKILSCSRIPTAIVTANDLTAIGALRAAHRHNLRIPDDLSIVGCDDIEMADIVHPPLTTLRISRREYARMLFEALRAASEDFSKPGKQFTVPMRLIVRQSTGPAPARSAAKPAAAKRKPATKSKR